MSEEITRFIIILAPFFSDFTVLLIVGMEYFSLKKESKIKVSRLIFYLICALISSSSFIFYFHYPKVFAIINPLVMFCFIMAQVFFYNFVFCLTSLQKEKFNRLHFLIPAIISLTLLALCITTPFEHQVETIENRGVVQEITVFNLLSNAKFPIRLIFSLVYTFFSFRRLLKYQIEVVNYSANYEKSSLKWLFIYLVLSLILIPIPLLGTLLSRDDFSSSGFTLVQVFLLIFQYAFITFHILRKNYIIVRNEKEDEKEEIKKAKSVSKTIELKKQQLTKETVNEYINNNKPFLDCNLKLGDLVLMLQTNRSYLSSFINNELNMNFSRFINSFRLSEYYKLKELHPNLSNDELVERAGFGSYKNFLRYYEAKDI